MTEHSLIKHGRASKWVLSLCCFSALTLVSACGILDSQHPDEKPLPEKFKMPEPVPLPERTIPQEALKPRATINFLLKRRKPTLDLSVLEEYPTKPTVSDLTLLQGEDGKFVTNLNLTGCRLNDTDLEPLAPLKLRTLSLNRCPVKDLHVLKSMTTLVHLNLEDCPISSESTKVISHLDNLLTLTLTRAKISDRGLTPLYSMQNLRKLDLSGCPNVSQKAVEELKEKLPQCDVLFRLEAKNGLRDGMEILHRIDASLMNQGEFDEADLSLEKLIERWKKEADPKYEFIAEGYRLRAQCMEKMQRPNDAAKMLDSAISTYTQHLPENEVIPKLEVSYARLKSSQNDLKGANSVRFKANAFWRRHPPSGSSRADYIENQAMIGRDLWELGHHQEAMPWFQKALAASKKWQQQKPVAEGICMFYIALAECEQGKPDAALDLLDKADAIFQRKNSPDRIIDILMAKAFCYEKKDQYPVAEDALKKALTISTANRGLRKKTYEQLVNMLKKEKKEAEAARVTKLFEDEGI